MQLNEVLKNVEFNILKGDTNRSFNAIQYDSRLVSSNDIFVCMTGYEVDGHTFIHKALENGASVIVCEKEIDLTNIDDSITVVYTKNNRQALAIMAANFYNHPTNDIKLIGVTGTNGKSTIVYMLKSILEEAGHKVGLVGTIANHIGNTILPSERTTPESLELQKMFRDMVDNGCDYCVMEVSSHSLDLDRVYGCNFEVSIFTNITRDHLDFHKTFENYYNAKFKLFARSNHAIVNMDNEYGEKIVNDLNGLGKSFTTISIKDSSYNCFADNITIDGTSVTFNIKDSKFTSILPGEYNTSNTLGAIAASKYLGIADDVIEAGLLNVVVPGRCEMVGRKYNLPYEIVIDYAHTPDGLENVLSTLKPFAKNRLIALYGSGGDRETAKRHELGRIGSEIADFVILASDNPKEEDPMDILNDLADGISKDNYIIIEDRAEAIAYATSICKEGDVLVLAGKGHENYQIVKGGKVHFDEREVLQNIFQ